MSRPPLLPTWTDVVDLIRPTVYWIGYSARPQGDTRYDITFVGTGFAISEFHVVTNYHVAMAVDDAFGNIRSDLEPVMVAVRAGTKVFGEGTFFLGQVRDRRLLGFWHPGYDGTVNSPDIAFFHAFDPVSDQDDFELINAMPFARLASLDVAMALEVGQEVGVLGFPGVLETNHNPYSLTPTPTFQHGTISALRPYDDDSSLTSDAQRALASYIVQHNLDTAPGNSGSPIFNRRGEVVAIHNAGVPIHSFNFGIRADEIRLFFKAFVVSIWPDISHINAKPVGSTLPWPPPYLPSD